MIRAVLFSIAVASASAPAQTILVRDVEDWFDFWGSEPVPTDAPLTTAGSFAREPVLGMSPTVGSRFHAFVARVDVGVPYAPSMTEGLDVESPDNSPVSPPILTAAQTLPAIFAGVHHDRARTAPGDHARFALEEVRITSVPNQPQWPTAASGRFSRRRPG